MTKGPRGLLQIEQRLTLAIIRSMKVVALSQSVTDALCWSGGRVEDVDGTTVPVG